MQNNCSFCPLSGRKTVRSQLVPASKLIVVGEAPGQEEELQGKPFVGPSGRLLDWAFAQAGIYRPATSIVNVVNCRPPDNDISSLEGHDATNACRFRFMTELEQLASGGATTVLALGATAMHALGISGAIEKNRGSVYEFKLRSGLKLNVIPTYHPAAIMRQHWKRNGGGSADAGVLWTADFRKANDIANNGFQQLQELFELEPTVSKVQAFVDEALRTNALIAVDTETTGLSWHKAKIVVIGLAINSERAISVPLLTTDGKPYWNFQDESTVRALLDKLFGTCDLMFQNCFFDVPMLLGNGFTVPLARVKHDTLLLHHTIASELPHDLGNIVSLYGKTPYWKEEFKTRNVPITKMNQIEMRRYNLRDCVVLHQVFPSMWSDLQELNLVDFYRTEVQPLIQPILEMTLAGVGFNESGQRTFKAKLEALVSERQQILLKSANLPTCFNLDSDEHLRWFLFGIEPGTFKHLPELATKKPGTKVYQQLIDLQTVKDEAKPRYTLSGWSPSKTATGKASVDKQGILSFQIQLNNRLASIKDNPKFTEEVSKIVDTLKWLTAYTEYTGLTKLATTYTKYKPEDDGRIYCRWLAHGTVSGRLSAREPNLMQLPKGKDNIEDELDNILSEVRKLFTARKGWSFVSADFVNLEAQLLGLEADDPELIKVFAEGLNLHDLNTKAMFQIDETSPMWKSARAAAKIFFFGGISYGGGDRTIFEKVCLKAPELNLTFAQFKQLKDNWMNSHPAYVKWHDAVQEEVKTKRELRTEFGRFRSFLSNDSDIVREALDFKVQSAGASLVNRAMIRVYNEKQRLGLKAKFVLQIHDQLVLEAPDDELEVTANLLKTEMERPFLFRGVERSIGVDLTTGKTLADL